MDTTGGHRFQFRKFRWAIIKGRTDDISQRAEALHAKAGGDARFALTETQDPDIVGRTMALMELA
jgi:hypothetical protein